MDPRIVYMMATDSVLLYYPSNLLKRQALRGFRDVFVSALSYIGFHTRLWRWDCAYQPT